jgi:hypothetical protein
VTQEKTAAFRWPVRACAKKREGAAAILRVVAVCYLREERWVDSALSAL